MKTYRVTYYEIVSRVNYRDICGMIVKTGENHWNKKSLDFRIDYGDGTLTEDIKKDIKITLIIHFNADVYDKPVVFEEISN